MMMMTTLLGLMPQSLTSLISFKNTLTTSITFSDIFTKYEHLTNTFPSRVTSPDSRDGRTDGQTDGRTDGRRAAMRNAAFKWEDHVTYTATG